MLRKLIKGQMSLSRRFDNLLPVKYRVDGNQDYIKSFVPKYLKENIKIYDIGGGKNPYLSQKAKASLNATVIGLDIDREELERAPEGLYDDIICADISTYQGRNDADVVLCQALLEHVKDVEAAFSAIASLLKPGGVALIFVPSRNAVFARLNLLLPQELKKSILYTIYPNTKRDQGFPSFYDKCTPFHFKQLAQQSNLSIREERFYYISTYFVFFFPAHFLWRLWILFFHWLRKEQAAETFSLALIKESR